MIEKKINDEVYGVLKFDLYIVRLNFRTNE